MSYPHFSVECGKYHDLVVDFVEERPTTVVLCGSTRFAQAFRDATIEETLAGRIVLSIGVNLRDDHDLAHVVEGIHPGVAVDDELAALKNELDDLHKRKIDLADEVYVLNVDGYVGDSTRSEIEYATKLGKPIRYLVAAAAPFYYDTVPVVLGVDGSVRPVSTVDVTTAWTAEEDDSEAYS